MHSQDKLADLGMQHVNNLEEVNQDSTGLMGLVG